MIQTMEKIDVVLDQVDSPTESGDSVLFPKIDLGIISTETGENVVTYIQMYAEIAS